MAEVVTGEAVVLDLQVARFPGRVLALLLDLLVQVPVLVLAEFLVYWTAAGHHDPAAAAAAGAVVYAVVVIGYPLASETLTRGRTLGKMALGLRVVSDDGGPVRFRQALVRALAGAFVEIWPPVSLIGGMPAGLIASMISSRGKRLGDLFAGTFVLQERVPARPELAPGLAGIAPWLQQWAAHAEVAMLSEQTAAAASGFLRRLPQLRPQAREALGTQLAAAVAAQVSPPPPPGTRAVDYLAAVLAVRRQREAARADAGPGAGTGTAPAPVPAVPGTAAGADRAVMPGAAPPDEGRASGPRFAPPA